MLDEERHGLIEEACGVWAMMSRAPLHDTAPQDALTGILALQHRGQESAGVVWQRRGDSRLHALHTDGLARALCARLPSEARGEVAVAHVRYSTSGTRCTSEHQPLVLDDSQFGPLTLAHNGHITNADLLREQLVERGAHFETSTDSEVILQAIAWQDAEDFEQAICQALRRLEGAYSIALHSPRHGLVIARDPQGIRPLVFASNERGFIAASETCALSHVATRQVREVLPGEVIIARSGQMPRSLWPHAGKPRKACIFELVYFAHPDSEVFAHDVRQVRHKMGEALAREHVIPDKIDGVVHIPQSSLWAARGFAQQANLPLLPAITRIPSAGRTFLAPTQCERDERVRQKFHVNGAMLEGKRIILLDDSLVRGTTVRAVAAMCREAGAREIHVRIASPATLSPCHLGIATPTHAELIATQHDLTGLETTLGVDSLRYLSLDALRQIAQHPGQKPRGFCDACFLQGGMNAPEQR